MTFRISRLFFVLATLFSLAPAVVHAQRPLPADSSGRIGWPIPMTPKQHIASSAVFGAPLGMIVGGTAGWAAAMQNCPSQDRRLFGCERPSELPKYGVALGMGSGAYLFAVSAAVEAGCDKRDARRRARRGALRGLVAGVAPMLVYHAAGGDDPRTGWTLALGGSALQVASIAHATGGCVVAR